MPPTAAEAEEKGFRADRRTKPRASRFSSPESSMRGFYRLEVTLTTLNDFLLMVIVLHT